MRTKSTILVAVAASALALTTSSCVIEHEQGINSGYRSRGHHHRSYGGYYGHGYRDSAPYSGRNYYTVPRQYSGGHYRHR